MILPALFLTLEEYRSWRVGRGAHGGWKEVSKRVHGVNSDRRNDRDGNLTINNYTLNDTESGSREKLNSKTDDTKTRNHWVHLGAVATFVLAVVVLILLAVTFKKMQ